jgi:hypothetical protein
MTMFGDQAAFLSWDGYHHHIGLNTWRGVGIPGVPATGVVGLRHFTVVGGDGEARTLVFMDMGGGSLMPMDVVAGRTAGGYTEILSGVEPGQRVVTSAQYLLDSEANLAEVMRSMIGQMNMSDMNRTGGMKDTSGTTEKGAGMKDMDMPGMKAPPTATTPRR